MFEFVDDNLESLIQRTASNRQYLSELTLKVPLNSQRTICTSLSMDSKTFMLKKLLIEISNHKTFSFPKRESSKYVILEAAKSSTPMAKILLILSLDIIELLNSCFALPNTRQPLIFGQQGALWQNLYF